MERKKKCIFWNKMFHITFTETLPVDRRQERFGYFHRMLLYRKNSLFCWFVPTLNYPSLQFPATSISNHLTELLFSERIFLVFSIEYRKG